jgi:hypothetical protein
MTRWIRILFLSASLAVSSHAAESARQEASPSPTPLPLLAYHPEGDAIVIRNGTRWDNRPLYCNTRLCVVMAGEMPGVSGLMGALNAALVRGPLRLPFEQFAERVARYRPGVMEWELSDPKVPNLKITMTATTVAEGDGFAVQVKSQGAAAEDQLAWLYRPNETNATLTPEEGGFALGKFSVRLSDDKPLTAPFDYKWRFPSKTFVDDSKHLPEEGPGTEFLVPLKDSIPQDFVAVDSSTKPAPPLLPAAEAFRLGIERVTGLGNQITVDTPDPWLNAAVRASCAAMYGLYVKPTFVHSGSSRWRQAWLGWRVMDGATAYGWHDIVQSAARNHFTRQNKKPDPKRMAAEADATGTRQSMNSRFYGPGKVMSMGHGYDMQTEFFDQCCREWRATGDPAFEKDLLPALELHLQWARECFDPEDRGLYESYLNTWATDNQWYNGGGTVEESAYIYYQERAAAEMCARAGRSADAAAHNARADKIRDAVNRVLWLKDKGQYAAYVEQGGHRRVHDDAWVYSEHLPIEAGMATPEQAWQAMYYTDWAMEHFRNPYGGEMRQTSNWVPGVWSLRELYHGDNFAMALGYWLAGQADEGWEIFKGAMLDSQYGDPRPRSAYNKGRSQLISPGGLSQPNCAIDFNDITSMYCRALVEGMFGYRPDYPNGVVTIAPGLPTSWDHASIKTPDYSFSFRRDGATDRYVIGLKRPARMRLRLPVSAERVEGVLVNGKPAEWKIEPWPGVGMLALELPEGTQAEIAVNLAGRTAPVPAIEIAKKTGETTTVANALDPQGCLGPDAKPGHHMAFARVERGNVPYLQVYKVNVTDPAGEAAAAAKILKEAPEGAGWFPVPMDAVFNGDITTTFKQRYVSPRPNTVSNRLGYDGYSNWMRFAGSGGKAQPPDVKCERAASLVDKSSGRLVTPQKAVFAPIAGEKNTAFTSLWDNWPHRVTVPVGKSGDAVWVLLAGSTNPMQGRIANAVLIFRYADGKEEKLDLVPPMNFWSMLGFGNMDYNYKRDAFSLPKDPPPSVQLGTNCRAMVYGWKLRPGVELKEVTLETLSQEVIIGLMGVSVMNPR